MTDTRKLLERCARAARVFMTPVDWPYSDTPTDEDFALSFDEETLAITGTRVWYGVDGDVGGTGKFTWEPLTNLADAAELAIKCKVDVSWGKDIVRCERRDLDIDFDAFVKDHPTEQATYCYAVVNVVAQMAEGE